MRAAMSLYQQVEGYIRQHHLLEPGQDVLVGVSGGADSLCLMDCLYHLGYRLTIAHFDHQLRPESASEAEYVASLAGEYGLEAVIGQGDVRSAGRSLEEAARMARYRFLVDAAKRRGLQVIATGHTADDQTETILMHFLRGAGPSGLRGMLPKRDLTQWVGLAGAEGIWLVRPMLQVSHAQAQAHCEARGLRYLSDPSNRDPQFFRNRLRHELLPLLERYNPAIREVLLRLGQIMVAESELLGQLVHESWPAIVEPIDPQALRIRASALAKKPRALQRALLRAAVYCLRPNLRDVGYQVIERGLDYLLQKDRPTALPMLGGLYLYDFDEDAILMPEAYPLSAPGYPQLAGARECVLSGTGTIRLDRGWMLRIERVGVDQVPELIGRQAGPWKVWLNTDRMGGLLVVRPRRPGDRIRPLGMTGSVKVADLMVNRKIPKLARPRWPLVVAGDRVIWVPGLHISEEARVGDDTRQVLQMEVVPPEGEGDAEAAL